MIRAEFTQADASDLVERIKVKASATISGDFDVTVGRELATDMITVQLVKRVEATKVGKIVVFAPKTWVDALAATLCGIPFLRWIPYRYRARVFRFYKAVGEGPEKYILVREYSDEAVR